MNTTTAETLKTVFTDAQITVTGDEFATAQEIIKHCKQTGESAYYAAVAIINQFDLQPLYSTLEKELIKSGLFKC